MCDELTSVEAERDTALETLKRRTAVMVYLFNDLAKSAKCADCIKAADKILDELAR